MKLKGLLIIFGCLAIGEAVIHLTQVSLPSGVIGLAVLFGLLQSGMVKLEAVKEVARTLLDYLVFLILPACVSVMQYLDIIKADLLVLILATTLSTLLVLLVTGKTHTWVRLYLKKYKGGK